MPGVHKKLIFSFFRNKKILVIGGGDSACEEALFLTSISDDVTLMHRRSELKAQKAIQNKISKNKKIKVIYDSEIVEIKGNNNVESVLVKNNKIFLYYIKSLTIYINLFNIGFNFT